MTDKRFQAARSQMSDSLLMIQFFVCVCLSYFPDVVTANADSETGVSCTMGCRCYILTKKKQSWPQKINKQKKNTKKD